MAIVSPAQIVDGTTIDAADVNNPINTLANEFNGNIDNTNIKTNAAIDGSKIADGTIPPAKLTSFSSLSWSSIAVAPNSVTYNGNRNYDVVFPSTDLTGSISPGMRLKLTRNTAAPTQCTNLSSSGQYFNRTSASINGMTFTNNFTVSAWIKLNSYSSSANVIVSRYNNTNGWYFLVSSTGQVQIIGFNNGATNYRHIQSYQTVPLNKWVHVVGQLDMSGWTSATNKIMIDGVDVPVQFTSSGTNPTSLIQGGNLEVGSLNGGSNTPGNIKIAQLAIFNTGTSGLSQSTLRGYISQGLTGSETSLISAYSFNNSINDLNTTNANNLTANGSAVATNADSPFADAKTASVDEFGLVQTITYSTNTTINVQVPEGCALPTTGTINAAYYSPQKNPYGWISDKGRWSIVYMNNQTQSQVSPTGNTWYAFTGITFIKPTGSFDIEPNILARLDGSTTDSKDMIVTLSNTGSAPSGPMISSQYIFLHYGTTMRNLFTLPTFTSNTSSASTFVCYMEFGGVSLAAGGTYGYSRGSNDLSGTTITMTPSSL